mmetsp:Transcript_23288/g.34080  ORF Transcript_23288/g.34080 Transcript_23288/m.34080 type:complete len:251 (-) Transcript_23288:138-890(-)
MRVANKTASIPGGQILAASTSVGRKANSPRIARTTSSPNTNAPSGIPSDRLACVMSRSCRRPRGAEAIDVHNKIVLMGTVLRNFWYPHTPTREAAAVTSLTLPKNSGPIPRSLVMKYKNAPSLVGVDCHKNRNRAGLHTPGSLIACHNASTCSCTPICLVSDISDPVFEIRDLFSILVLGAGMAAMRFDVSGWNSMAGAGVEVDDNSSPCVLVTASSLIKNAMNATSKGNAAVIVKTSLGPMTSKRLPEK